PWERRAVRVLPSLCRSPDRQYPSIWVSRFELMMLMPSQSTHPKVCFLMPVAARLCYAAFLIITFFFFFFLFWPNPFSPFFPPPPPRGRPFFFRLHHFFSRF